MGYGIQHNREVETLMETIAQLLKFIIAPATVEAMALLFLLAIFLRLILPLLFDFRTKIQRGLEETYEAHIKELKEMIETQRSQMVLQGKQLHAISAKLSTVVHIVEQYNCKRSPDCENREKIAENLHELVEHAVCERCDTTHLCAECDYAYILDNTV